MRNSRPSWVLPAGSAGCRFVGSSDANPYINDMAALTDRKNEHGIEIQLEHFGNVLSEAGDSCQQF